MFILIKFIVPPPFAQHIKPHRCGGEKSQGGAEYRKSKIM